MQHFCRLVRIDTLSAIAISTSDEEKPQKFCSTAHKLRTIHVFGVFLPHCFVSLAQHNILRHRRTKKITSELVYMRVRNEWGRQRERERSTGLLHWILFAWKSIELHSNHNRITKRKVFSFLHHRYRSISKTYLSILFKSIEASSIQELNVIALSINIV